MKKTSAYSVLLALALLMAPCTHALSTAKPIPPPAPDWPQCACVIFVRSGFVR